nr:uncharacterized protein LOC113716902 [Coffea arabica]
MTRRVRRRGMQTEDQVVKKKMIGKGKELRMIEEKNLVVETQMNLADIRDTIRLPSLVGIETTEVDWLLAMLMIQVMYHQIILKKRCTQGDVNRHLLSGRGKDKFRGLLIASTLSAGILLTLLLRVPGMLLDISN